VIRVDHVGVAALSWRRECQWKPDAVRESRRPISVFPGELYPAPESWAKRAYRNLIYFHAVDKGGHFAAWEEPQLFAEEMRAAFRSLR
jgi:pimeloyl-ACP methyl ester carboxylesterase